MYRHVGLLSAGENSSKYMFKSNETYHIYQLCELAEGLTRFVPLKKDEEEEDASALGGNSVCIK